MTSLYRYQLDTETGSIKVTEVTNYEIGNYHNKGHYWRYRRNGSYNYCYEDDIDRFKHNQVYTFNPDIEFARKIIFNSLEDRRDRANREYIKLNQLVNKMYMGEVNESKVNNE